MGDCPSFQLREGLYCTYPTLPGASGRDAGPGPDEPASAGLLFIKNNDEILIVYITYFRKTKRNFKLTANSLLLKLVQFFLFRSTCRNHKAEPQRPPTKLVIPGSPGPRGAQQGSDASPGRIPQPVRGSRLPLHPRVQHRSRCRCSAALWGANNPL